MDAPAGIAPTLANLIPCDRIRIEVTLYVNLSRKTAYGEMAARLPSGLGPAAPQLHGPTLFTMQPLLERLISHPQSLNAHGGGKSLGVSP